MKTKFAIIGHIAFNEDITSFGRCVSLGGAAYYSAIGAMAANPNGVGIVASVGNDFDFALLDQLQLSTSGVRTIMDKKTAKFTIIQQEDGKRSFDAIWGAAEEVYLHLFPEEYNDIVYVHLATAPPMQQLKWIKMLRTISRKITISVDMFEKFAMDYPNESKQTIIASDFVFLNQDEALALDFENSVLSKKPHILKMGSNGALYSDGLHKLHIKAPKVDVIDTTGAGDVLAGAFWALRSNGVSIKSSLWAAINLASISVQKFGVNHLVSSLDYSQLLKVN